MSPSELLTQTQKAVGEKEMIEWHEHLIELRDEEKTLSTVNTYEMFKKPGIRSLNQLKMNVNSF